VRRAGGRRGGALAATLVFATPMLLWNKEGGANGTYSDLPLAAFLGAGLALLVHPRATGQPWRGGFAGLLLAAAVGTKNEGFGLAVAVVLAAVAVAWRGRRLGAVRRAKAPLVATAVVAGALALVLGWRSEVPNRNDEAYFESISASAIVAGLRERAALVGSEIPGRTLDPANFGGLFWLAPLLLVVGRRRLRSPAALLSATAIVVELVQILAAYAVVKDLWIIGVTWTRFLVQLTVPLALLLAAASRGALAAAGWSTARSQSNR
jgi:hypothetical protein